MSANFLKVKSKPTRLTYLLLFGLIAGCASNPFPEHWWHSDSNAPAAGWEILPEAAQNGEVILSKRNELGILSNFSATPFEYRKRKYASVEGFWQSMKFPEGPNDLRLKNNKIIWSHTREEVENMTGFDAKKAGDEASENMKLLKISWVTFEGRRFPYRSSSKGEHYRLIREAMEAKLEQNPKVRETLLSTRDLKLLPDHHQSAEDPPEWRYYEIWMEIREALKVKIFKNRSRRSCS